MVKIFIRIILFAHNKNENRSINKQLRRNFPIVSAIVVISTTDIWLRLSMKVGNLKVCMELSAVCSSILGRRSFHLLNEI